MHTEQTGILIVNLGSPDAPTAASVRRYLRQFLSDPRVIDIAAPLRWLLLYLIILPFRPKKSAAAYQKIWGERGSPLITNTQELVEALAVRLDELHPGKYRVSHAMRYGTPSIRSAFDDFETLGIRKVKVVPMYPQYSSATTGSILEEVYRVAGSYINVPSIEIIPPFYRAKGFVDAQVAICRDFFELFFKAYNADPDHILFSFHGLPERQILKADTGEHCLSSGDCCSRIDEKNSICYRAQCFETARAIADELGLEEHQWSVSFQSRLGKEPWIRPHTDRTIQQFARMGLKNVAVVAPSFTADCLETLEEIAIVYDEQFRAMGGNKIFYIPALNAHSEWVRALPAILGID